ncbi:hypothetical protein, partial [Kitasatospora sp. NPDC005751]|uniref:hypothetical protein n=1 Tax=Kitasatospora sp. NPDC005751 TaxID=3157064 RepID=UPI0033D167DB
MGYAPLESEAAGKGLSRRVKALACTRPLHDLDAHKGLLLRFSGWSRWGERQAGAGQASIDKGGSKLDVS